MTTSIWACALVLLVAAIADVATRKIPNLVTLGGLALGIVLHVALGIVDGGALGGLRGLGVSLGGALACAIIPFLAWRRGEMGGGDVKLFAAIGALAGPAIGFDVQAMTFLLSFVVLFPYRLVRHGALRVGIANIGIGLKNLVRARPAKLAYLAGPKLPPVVLGPAIALAFCLALARHGALR
jgi:prepilin peptidase CpaA